MIFKVDITLKREAPIDLLDIEDAEDSALVDGFQQIFIVRVQNATEAGTRALDIFHSQIAISCLDDFTIEETVHLLSAHEQMALETELGTDDYFFSDKLML